MNRRRVSTMFLALIAASGIMAMVRPAMGTEEETSATTVIVVRHAEKQVDVDDPGLTPAGEERASRLRDLTIEAGVTAVYATQFERTQATVRPLAEELNLDVEVVDARETAVLVERILSDNAGKAVVVAGHSNTVPGIVAALGAPQPAEIPETDYDNLFVVTVFGSGEASVVRLQF